MQVDRLLEVHHLDDAQVVEGAEQRQHDGDHRQPDQARHVGRDQRLQHRQLGVEADRGRNAGEREHEHGHDAGEPGAAFRQAAEIVDQLGFVAGARKQHDHAEGAERREHVGDDVEHRRAVGVARRNGVAADDARAQPEQHEADLRDRRVRQHPLEVRLGDRREVAEQHRADRKQHQHLLPVGGQADHAFDEQPDRDRERGELGRAADQERRRRGRALVDIGHPHVERHGAELEAEAGDDEDRAQNQHRPVDLAVGDGLEDVGDRERAGRAVHHGQAVEEKAARQRTEHEVLHRRFGRRAVVPAHRDDRVQAQRHQLEAEVDDQEVVGREHDQDAQEREHREREQLALQDVAARAVGACVDQRGHHRQRREQAEHVPHRVGDDHVLHGVERVALGQIPAVDVPEVDHGDEEERPLRQAIGDEALPVGDPEVGERDDAGHRQQGDLGKDGDPVHGETRGTLGAPTWRSSSLTETCITSVNGLG